MMKKIKYFFWVLLVLFVAALIAAPYILEANIGDLLKNNVNSKTNATLDIKDAKLNLMSSFPNAEVSLTGVTLTNKAPFAGDTLFAAKHIDLKIGILQLFKNEDKRISIQSLFVDEANLNLTIDATGNASYNIGKASESQNESTATDLSSGFKFYLESYEIINSNISYVDETEGLSFLLSNFQHRGAGDLSLENSELDTNTAALVSFEMDSTNYLDKIKIKLDAVIGIELKENKYSFLKNEASVNQLPLVFNGYVKLNEDNKEVDIKFKTSSSDFKNFLALISETNTKSIENATSTSIKDVSTTGNFEILGKFNGVLDDNQIPKFTVKVNSDKASFQYPNLPKAVRDISIDIAIANTTGIIEDTFVVINKFSFMIDDDTFNIVSKITKLMGNAKVNAHVDGILNLANIGMSYPVPIGMDLKGLLNTDITTTFDMASIEQKRYEDTSTFGNLTLTDFEYKLAELPNTVSLDSTLLSFNPKTVTLNQLKGKVGNTDLSATGTINNLLGFIFNDEMMQGNFNLKSDTFVLKDFMTVTTQEFGGSKTNGPLTADEKIKIPSFLDANIDVAANKVLYDDLVLKDVQGNLKIKDEKAIISNMTTSIFDGNMTFNGEVSTKNEIPNFAMKIGMDTLQITETFKSLELFKVLAPIAHVLKGNFDSDIELSGSLDRNFTPNLSSLRGDIFARVLAISDINTKKAPILSGLNDKLGLRWIEELDLSDLKTKMSFKDGLVSVKPFEIKYRDIVIVIDGTHTFDRKIDYKAVMNLPAKYLGSKVSTLIAAIDDRELEDLTVPVTAKIGGNYVSPKYTININSVAKELTSKLIKIQKQKLISQGTDKTKSLIKDILGNTISKKDSTQKKGGASAVLSSVLEGGKKDSLKINSDSTPVKKKEEVLKDAAKDILGGFLGNKKK